MLIGLDVVLMLECGSAVNKRTIINYSNMIANESAFKCLVKCKTISTDA